MSEAHRKVCAVHDGVGEVAHDVAQEGGCAGVVLCADEHSLVVAAVEVRAEAAAAAAAAVAAASRARRRCTAAGWAGRVCAAARRRWRR